MRQDPIESYIFGNGGVESALGDVGVEYRGGGTCDFTGGGAVLRDESLGVTGAHGTGATETGTSNKTFFFLGTLHDEALLETEPETGAGSGPFTSCTLSTGRTENLLKLGYLSGRRAAALAITLSQNPP